MDDSGAPSPPGDGGGGTNSSGGGVFSSDASFSTNGLWMQLTGITNGIGLIHPEQRDGHGL